MSIVLLIVGLLLFIGLVVVHEWGHFIAARRNGVDVEEFGIGFPPRAWAKKTKGGFDFSINWLPIGGFVKLKGESDSAKEKGSLGAASTWSKSKIMLAGVFMNLIIAYLLLTILSVTGMPRLLPDQFSVASDTKIVRNDVLVAGVEKDSPAARGGLRDRDVLVSVRHGDTTERIRSAEGLSKLTEKYAGQKVTIQYERKGESRQAVVALRSIQVVKASQKTDNPKGHLGIGRSEYTITRATWSAPVNAAGLIAQITKLTFQGLGTAVAAVFQGNGAKAAENVSGPVGIVVLLKEGSLIGPEFVLFLIAIISLTLAIMNVLPIPALDGGRLYMVLLSRLFGKQLTQEMEERIVGGSFLFLLFLIVLITVVDVRRFF